MVANESKGGSQSAPSVSDWVACHNPGDDVIVLSCTVSTTDQSNTITSVGLILNDSKGTTLASVFTAFSGSNAVFPSINLPPEGLAVGDTVNAVVQGECDNHHYFFEEKLTITNC